jgi:hypothetical protein
MTSIRSPDTSMGGMAAIRSSMDTGGSHALGAGMRFANITCGKHNNFRHRHNPVFDHSSFDAQDWEGSLGVRNSETDRWGWGRQLLSHSQTQLLDEL